MKKNNIDMQAMKDDLFDTMLKHAFAAALEERITDYEKDLDKVAHIQPSKKHLREEHQEYRAVRMKEFRTSKKGIRIIAAVVAALVLAVSIPMAHPDIRACFADKIVSFFDDYLRIDFDKDVNSFQLDEYTLGYMPKGYVLSETIPSKSSNRYFFTKDDLYITVIYSTSALSYHNLDSEIYDITKIDLPKYTAYSCVPLDNSMHKIVLVGNENITIQITSNESMDELIKISKSIK